MTADTTAQTTDSTSDLISLLNRLKLRLTTRAAGPADTGTWYDLPAIDEFDTAA